MKGIFIWLTDVKYKQILICRDKLTILQPFWAIEQWSANFLSRDTLNLNQKIRETLAWFLDNSLG